MGREIMALPPSGWNGTAPRVRTDRSNELRLVPRPPRCIRVEAYETSVGAHCGSAMGREIMAPITYLSEVRQWPCPHFSNRP
jgi:hypothetical protein